MVEHFDEVVVRLEVGAAPTVSERPRVRHRHPALSALGHPATRQGTVPADPHRDGRLHRRRMGGAAIEREVTPLIGDALASPDQAHDLERLVEQLVALVEVDPDRVELLTEIAGAHAEDDPAAAEAIEGGDGLREDPRVAIRQRGEVRQQPQPARRGSGESEPDEGVECVMAARFEPGVVRERVLGQRHRVEPRRRGSLRHRGEGVEREQLGVLGMGHHGQSVGEAHPGGLPSAAVGRS